MANPKAFLTVNRKEAGYRAISERIADFSEVEQQMNHEDHILQASRCMDCGVPFCHWSCPLGNKMPEWQDLMYKDKWLEAYDLLTSTNNFPEFTGRICPALCEKGCVLNIDGQPVTVRENEGVIAEYAFREGYVKPRPPRHRTGKSVAIIGSGPAGLATADMLNRKGHTVTVFEKDEVIGGLLRLGIPDFKLNKRVIDRRIDILQQEGIIFKTGMEVGKDVSKDQLLSGFDAVCICIGSGKPRDLAVKGRELKGVCFALEMLQQQNRVVSGMLATNPVSAKGKHVVVIGGGDTGSDCVGTSIRHKAASVTQIEILSKPPVGVNPQTPWPYYPNILKTSSSHREGCERRWSLSATEFIGENGCVSAVEVAEVEWNKSPEGKMILKETGKKELLKADLVLLSMGFVHPVHEGLLDELGVEYDSRGNVASAQGKTSLPNVFVAGDAALGASLVVRAIDSGRKAANSIHRYLS